ncbi:MucR family transcriptional regulator [Aestuariispira ectoiniformans]|uniref:MucR family transcriptional regulator n=1 Tax=Aestuariispira ectoiniformans TaxID=2775080 RepID=UPI00223AEDA7|nr:MucR family transcriptional regulator [Aestuariispira ectoiniformans]
MSDQLQDAALRADLVRCTADIVGAYVGNNKTSSDAIPGLIEMVFTSFNRLNGSSASRSAPSRKAAISVKKSVTPDYLVCLEDGKKLKMLKRHLRTNYDMTPEEYRNKWGLPADYPMVAPNYAAQRSAFAKKIGLGRNRAQA